MNLAIAGLLTLLLNNPHTGHLVAAAALEKPSFLVKTNENIVLEVPFIHQIENLPEEQKAVIRGTACGPASLTMALKYLGVEISLMEVINTLPTSVYIKGDRFYNLPSGAQYFGKESEVIGNKPKDIYSALEAGHPIILNVQNYDGITGHAVIAVGMVGFTGETAEALIVHDPFVGEYRRFEYAGLTSIRQPEGYINPIGNTAPFYVK